MELHLTKCKIEIRFIPDQNSVRCLVSEKNDPENIPDKSWYGKCLLGEMFIMEKTLWKNITEKKHVPIYSFSVSFGGRKIHFQNSYFPDLIFRKLGPGLKFCQEWTRSYKILIFGLTYNNRNEKIITMR